MQRNSQKHARNKSEAYTRQTTENEKEMKMISPKGNDDQAELNDRLDSLQVLQKGRNEFILRIKFSQKTKPSKPLRPVRTAIVSPIGIPSNQPHALARPGDPGSLRETLCTDGEEMSALERSQG